MPEEDERISRLVPKVIPTITAIVRLRAWEYPDEFLTS